MKKFEGNDFKENKAENVKLVKDVLGYIKKNPASRQGLSLDMRKVIKDKASSNMAKAHTLFLLGQIGDEDAVEDIIEQIDKPLIDSKERGMPKGQADALSALVMLGQKAVSGITKALDKADLAKMRGLVSAYFIITKETTVIKDKLAKRIEKATAKEKASLQELLKDVNNWKA